jgi:hypothetical protein
VDVWISACRKTSKCHDCEQQIVNHDYMVVTKLWRGRGVEGQPIRFPIVNHYHTTCWVARGIRAVEMKGHVENRGRKLTPMSDECRTERVRIMRQRAAIVQRLRAMQTRGPAPNRLDRIAALGGKLCELRERIEAYGGAPKGW